MNDRASSALHSGEAPQGASPIRGWTSRARRLLASLRTRLVLSYVLLLALSTTLSLFTLRQILHVRLDEQINTQLVQEVREFRALVGGNDPATGRPFGSDLKAVFDVFLNRNVPAEGELILAIVRGKPYIWKRAHDASYRIERRADLIERWSKLKGTERGELETPAGAARYLAVPVILEGKPAGTFVVANFPAFEQGEIDAALRAAFALSIGVLVIALLLAWSLAGRVLGPLRLFASTARSITDSDLTARIRVRGHDEVAQLAATFNDMLDRLEDAFRVQREFVDDAGHELRTPITIIRGHLELLEDDPEQRRETLALVMDELQRMERMVNDLLVLAKSGQPDFLDLELVDLERLTEELHAKARGLAPRRWELERSAQGRIVADRQRLTQALMQLADNAVNHTQEGQLIALGSALADGEVRFWVRDSGPGIANEDRERIFERFSRGRNTRRTSSDGAGLGLAIVRAIAEAHRGRLEVESPVGQGAKFVLFIPADQPVSVHGRKLEEVSR